ncbi:hypothetical protein CFC21_020233 [Triticum aestivum]|uniref:Peroxidase n=4 Tax=Triticum TaxID=4564 RepID=A0A9R1P9J9_TRITD|nr:hypothetical protein CFC21_020233 [Triticum aestivum]VAH39357.1 unnamed protein product [Triticum turgidum subsp. durum]
MAALSRAAMVLTMMGLAATSALSQPSLISMTTDVPLPDGLSYDFHALSCNNLQNMVREAVQGAMARDAGVVPGLLRLFFHDCFPQGCDASILLTGGNSEQNMPQNGGLRRSVLDLIESIRATVHRACGPTVSCADITSLATKEAVMQSRLPGYDVPLGRRDSLAPATAQQVGILPGPDFNVQQLVRNFADRGFDKMDLVALSGAHTVGKASCGSFRNRAGENADFVRMLQQVCARNPGHLQDLDVTTPNTFDNRYFNNLQMGRGVLNSDMALTHDGETKNWVNNFAGNQGWFFSQFSTSMRKLAHLPGGNIGEIRNNCFRRNGNGESVFLAAEVFAAFA